eukprot:6549249-Pyramimonas_sp.AAC.1
MQCEHCGASDVVQGKWCELRCTRSLIHATWVSPQLVDLCALDVQAMWRKHCGVGHRMQAIRYNGVVQAM